jgi:hypothetical protein
VEDVPAGSFLPGLPAKSRRTKPNAVHINGDEPGMSPPPPPNSGPKANHVNSFGPKPETESDANAIAVGGVSSSNG